MQKRQNGYLRRPYKQLRKEEKQKAKRKRKIYPFECRVPKNSKESKKAFLTDQCKEIQENNRMGKARDLFKTMRDTKEKFHAKGVK